MMKVVFIDVGSRGSSQGAGLVVSDFMDEYDGYLRLTPEQATTFPIGGSSHFQVQAK